MQKSGTKCINAHFLLLNASVIIARGKKVHCLEKTMIDVISTEPIV